MATSPRDELPLYYQTLQISPDATTSDIRQAYLRLIRLSHPDKIPLCQPGHPQSSAQRVIEAYTVLADEDRRKTYDVQLKLERADSRHQVQCETVPHQPIVSQVLDLSEFTQVSSSSTQINDDTGAEKFVYPCRCGGEFMISSQDMDCEKDIIGCTGCSLTVKVEFEYDFGDSL